jgi:hypothetical protein
VVKKEKKNMMKEQNKKIEIESSTYTENSLEPVAPKKEREK